MSSSDLRIQIHLADDHPTFRLGIRALAEQAPDLDVIAETSEGHATLAQIRQLRPTVAVLDCQLPGLSGADVAAEVRLGGLPTRILAVSAFGDAKHVRDMLAAGALGYLLKDEAPSVIVEGIRSTARGEGRFSHGVTRWLGGLPRNLPELTRREHTVLKLISTGRTNKEIAGTLGIAERTVEFHIGNLLAKLQVSSRTEAAVWAKDFGYDIE